MRVGYLGIALLSVVVTAAASAADAPNGEHLYRRYCAGCHGATGQGDGPDASYFAARPRDLREGFLDKYPTDDLVRRIQNGRTLELAFDLPALQARADEVEAIVAHLKRLPAINWREVEPGWELYVDRCEACHGATGKPPAKLPAGVRPPPDLADPAVQRSLTEQQLQRAVRHGHDWMPALLPRVSEADGPSLAKFVRLLSPGFELYSRYCATCHGDDGRGGGGLIEDFNVPQVVFDRAYFQRRSPEQVRDAVWHMVRTHKAAMPHFRWTLSDDQARAIVTYLKGAP